MVQLLQPFIVTSWHGHRNDTDIPEVVRKVWSQKFARGHRNHGQSNVDLAVLSSEGELIHWFDGFPIMNVRRFHRPGHHPPKLGPAESTVRELKAAIERMGLTAESEKNIGRPITLPVLGPGQRGVRLFVSLLDDRMTAYQAPVVEVVSLSESEMRLFDFPTNPKSIDANELKSWLSLVYPPGVMERTNPHTKYAYHINEVSGALDFVPLSPVANGQRRALLSGTIRLSDEGPDEFFYEGQLEILFTYHEAIDKPTYEAFVGTFDGIYPRKDPHHGVRQIPLRAAFESNP